MHCIHTYHIATGYEIHSYHITDILKYFSYSYMCKHLDMYACILVVSYYVWISSLSMGKCKCCICWNISHHRRVWCAPLHTIGIWVTKKYVANAYYRACNAYTSIFNSVDTELHNTAFIDVKFHFPFISTGSGKLMKIFKAWSIWWSTGVDIYGPINQTIVCI